MNGVNVATHNDLPPAPHVTVYVIVGARGVPVFRKVGDRIGAVLAWLDAGEAERFRARQGWDSSEIRALLFGELDQYVRGVPSEHHINRLVIELV